jgi:hypothetical protein
MMIARPSAAISTAPTTNRREAILRFKRGEGETPAGERRLRFAIFP